MSNANKFKRELMEGNNTERIKPLTELEIYDLLRQAHSLVKDIIYSNGYNRQNEQIQNAIDGVHSVH